MSAPARRASAAPVSLARLRLRLTIWYTATFAVIVALLGAALFGTITRRLDRALDASLRDATRQLVRAARTREREAAVASAGMIVDAVDELHVSGRDLYLFDTAGHAVKPTTAPLWIDSVALRAAQQGEESRSRRLAGDRIMRAHAERFVLESGRPMVALAVAEEIELEDRYPSLIAAFTTAALLAILLVAAGGWIVARQSTDPVERTIAYMRRFMADAAHELRTPITVLRSRAEVALQQERDTEAYVAALSGVAAESERMGRIVEDLLTLAQADAGERRIERQRVFLDDIVLDAAGAVRALGQSRGVDVSVDRFDETVVEGDPTLLRQLVMILLDNAVKFTDRGGAVRVSIGVTAGRPTLTIADTGAGIPADQLPHVFERFYRGDLARTRQPAHGAAKSGAGLGLSIAQWIAAEHRAQIRLESTAGEGTTAIVQFPTPGAARLDDQSLGG